MPTFIQILNQININHIEDNIFNFLNLDQSIK